MGTVGGSYSWNAVCDVCGFRFKANELKKRWDGLIVCADDFEHRHPMDFYRVKNDAHTLPFTRLDPEVTMHDPYYVPHPDSWYTKTKTFQRTAPPEFNPGLEGYVYATTWLPTTTVQIKGIRFWVFPEQIGTNENEYRFDVVDGYTQANVIYPIIPVRKFIAGWNYIWFDELSNLTTTKDTFVENGLFHIAMQSTSNGIAMPYYTPDTVTLPYSYGPDSWTSSLPALVEKQATYICVGAYGEYGSLFPGAAVSRTVTPLIEPIYSIRVTATNEGLIDKRYMLDVAPTLQEHVTAYNYGYSFTANKDLTVTAFRIWAGDLTTTNIGRGTIHLWNSLGTDLTINGVVPNFTMDAANSYQWHTIDLGSNDISLTSGNTYTLSINGPVTGYGDPDFIGYNDYPFLSDQLTFNPNLTMLTSFDGVSDVAGKKVAGAPAKPSTASTFFPLIDIVAS